MYGHAFTLFKTAIGWCGLAWSARGIAAVQLPEADEATTRRRLMRHCPHATEEPPPPDVKAAIDGIVALLAGEPRDLLDVQVDSSGVSPLHRRVYAVARTIAPGETATYGEIATKLGEPDSARAVGRALGQNPVPIIVPCHRVLGAKGRTGGFSAPGGIATKLRILTIEQARIGAAPLLFANLPLAAGR